MISVLCHRRPIPSAVRPPCASSAGDRILRRGEARRRPRRHCQSPIAARRRTMRLSLALALALAIAAGPHPGAAYDPINFPTSHRDTTLRRGGGGGGGGFGYGSVPVPVPGRDFDYHLGHHHGHGPHFGPPEFDPEFDPDFDSDFAPDFRPQPGPYRPTRPLPQPQPQPQPRRPQGPGRVGGPRPPYGPGDRATSSASASASASSSSSSSGGSRASASASASASSNARCGVTIELTRIILGNVSEPGQFPWQAALFYSRGGGGSETVLCGGALVHERYVVTAAHCLHPTIINNYRLTKVRLGEWDTSSARDCVDTKCAPPPVDFAVERELLHPGYVARKRPAPGTRHNAADIALLRLDRPAPYTDYIRPLCLPEAAADARSGDADARQGERLTVAGWGATENDTSSDRLRFVQLPVQSHAQCTRSLNIDIQPTQLCVGGVEGKDSCTGDSGGPLVAARSNAQGHNVYQLVGVVSFGGPCGRDQPAVYTRVAAFLPWLRENMRP